MHDSSAKHRTVNVTAQNDKAQLANASGPDAGKDLTCTATETFPDFRAMVASCFVDAGALDVSAKTATSENASIKDGDNRIAHRRSRTELANNDGVHVLAGRPLVVPVLPLSNQPSAQMPAQLDLGDLAREAVDAEPDARFPDALGIPITTHKSQPDAPRFAPNADAGSKSSNFTEAPCALDERVIETTAPAVTPPSTDPATSTFGASLRSNRAVTTPTTETANSKSDAHYSAPLKSQAHFSVCTDASPGANRTSSQQSSPRKIAMAKPARSSDTATAQDSVDIDLPAPQSCVTVGVTGKPTPAPQETPLIAAAADAVAFVPAAQPAAGKLGTSEPPVKDANTNWTTTSDGSAQPAAAPISMFVKPAVSTDASSPRRNGVAAPRKSSSRTDASPTVKDNSEAKTDSDLGPSGRPGGAHLIETGDFGQSQDQSNVQSRSPLPGAIASASTRETPARTVPEVSSPAPWNNNFDFDGGDSSFFALPAVVSTAKLMQSLTQSEFRIGLQSREMGTINIHTSIAARTFSAQIFVERSEVANMLMRELPDLYSRLADQRVLAGPIQIHNDGLSTLTAFDQGGRQDSAQPFAGDLRPTSLEKKIEAVPILEAIPAGDRLDVRI